MPRDSKTCNPSLNVAVPASQRNGLDPAGSRSGDSVRFDSQSGAAVPNSPQEPLLTRGFVAICIVNLCVFMGWHMTTVGIPVYLSGLGAPDWAVGLSTTIATVAAIIFRPIVGLLVDHYGRRGFVIGGLLFMTLSTVCYAVFPVVGIVLALRALHGFGWGFGQTAVNTVAADVIPKRRFAEGMGYFAMVNSLAVAFAPALSIQLLSTGNADIMIGCASAFTLLSALVAIWFFATGYQEPPWKRERPRAASFAPSRLLERNALVPGIIMMFMNMGFGTITTFISLWGMSKGLDNMSFYFLVYAFTNIVTRPPIGKLIDRYGFWAPGILACLCFSASLLTIAFADSYVMFSIAGVLVGLGLGTGMGVFQTMAVSKVHPSRRGAATSTFMVFFDLGIGGGAMLAGFIAGSAGYGGCYLAMAVCPVISLVIFLAMGKKRVDSYHV